MGGAVWGGGEWAGVCRGLRLLVYRQVPQGVGSVNFAGSHMGAPALVIATSSLAGAFYPLPVEVIL